MASSAADILKSRKRIKPCTKLEEFGLTLFLGSISEKESAEYEASRWRTGTTEVDPAKLKSARRKLIALTICDEEGNRLLSEEQAGEMDSYLADVLFSQADEFTRVKPVKNSKTASGEDLPCDSRHNAGEPTSTNS
jgi:hypothetical protein